MVILNFGEGYATQYKNNSDCISQFFKKFICFSLNILY